MLLIALPPCALFGFPTSCKWCRIFGEELVVYSRYFLVPKWSLPVRSRNQGSERDGGRNQFQGQETEMTII